MSNAGAEISPLSDMVSGGTGLQMRAGSPGHLPAGISGGENSGLQGFKCYERLH